MKRITMILSCLVALCMVADVSAQSRRQQRRAARNGQVTMNDAVSSTIMLSQPSQSVNRATTVEESRASVAATQSLQGVDDALTEVNEYRARRGLPAFLPDPLLNQAAKACAKQRAARGIHGHLPESDFSYLPSGGNASSAGCGALEDSWGWGTCCMNDNYTYAGAAWYRGADGRRYMHLFVR